MGGSRGGSKFQKFDVIFRHQYFVKIFIPNFETFIEVFKMNIYEEIE